MVGTSGPVPPTSAAAILGAYEEERSMDRRQRTRCVAAAALIAISAFGGACSGGDGGDEVTPRPTGSQANDPALVEGRAVFIANCARCHGGAAQGGIGPKLAEGRVAARYPEIADQVDVVRDGRGSMPAFRDALSRAEIRAVVRYLREVT
jgi:mono/diheme cytochrome c family protein